MNALTERDIRCPYCNEPISVLIDPQDLGQQYIEDCQVCCKPIVFTLSDDAMGGITVDVRSEDEAY